MRKGTEYDLATIKGFWVHKDQKCNQNQTCRETEAFHKVLMCAASCGITAALFWTQHVVMSMLSHYTTAKNMTQHTAAEIQDCCTLWIARFFLCTQGSLLLEKQWLNFGKQRVFRFFLLSSSACKSKFNASLSCIILERMFGFKNCYLSHWLECHWKI